MGSPIYITSRGTWPSSGTPTTLSVAGPVFGVVFGNVASSFYRKGGVHHRPQGEMHRCGSRCSAKPDADVAMRVFYNAVALSGVPYLRSIQHVRELLARPFL